MHYRKICLSRENGGLLCASRLTEHGKEIYAVHDINNHGKETEHGTEEVKLTGKKQSTAKRYKSSRQIFCCRQRHFAVRRSTCHGKDVDQNLPQRPQYFAGKHSVRAARSRVVKEFAGNVLPCGSLPGARHNCPLPCGSQTTTRHNNSLPCTLS